MEQWTLDRAARVAGGEVRGRGGNRPITQWTYDSRLPAPAEGNCFLALAGGRRSGFAYVEELLARGVRLFCVSVRDAGRLSPKQLTRGTFWIVEDVLSSVQALAAEHRTGLRGEVVAITGSNGKTIVKEWLYRLLSAVGFEVYRSPASHNSQLGVALSVLHDRGKTTEVHVFEAGVSRAGEMAKLQAMIRPTLGVLTNIGAAHDDGFEGREQKVREKLSLFAGAQALVYDFDELYVDTGDDGYGYGALLTAPKKYGWCAEDEDDAARQELDTVFYLGAEVTVLPRLDDAAHAAFAFPCPFEDAASRQNFGHALMTCLRIGLRAGRLTPGTAYGFVADLRAAIPTLRGLDMRLRVYAGRGGHRVIDDSYTADREGLRAAAEFFSQHRIANSRACWLLGPLAEAWDRPGASTEKYLGELVSRYGIEEVHTAGPELRSVSFADAVAHRHYPTTAALLDSLRVLPTQPTTFLVKGPRADRFDLVAAALRERAHGLRMEISLPALAANVVAYRARLRPETKICVMVKAEAYGAGGPEVAAFLEQRGVDYLAVATVDEGVALRRAGVRLPVIVAHATEADVDRIREHALEPEVTSLEQAHWYSGRDVGVHLKLDTGMRRLGFDATDGPSADFEALLGLLSGRRLRVRSVFSHLAAADRADEEADAYTRAQHGRLLAGANATEAALGYRPLIHLLNSAGAWRFPEMQHDMVRLGIGVYGAGLERIAPGALEPAHRWVAQIVQIRDVPAGESVGYGLGGRAGHARRIGIINVGYADGLRRAAGDGRFSLVVDGKLTPTVGSVCMDFAMVDLANVPHAAIGDEAEVFGPQQPVRVLARAYDTIAYEVFTGIGSRVRRVFYR